MDDPVDDPFDLGRFVAAQGPVLDRVRAELVSGRKATHWMWFVFPQLRGLGSSAMAERYGISGLPEAEAYHAHAPLGERLVECTRLVLAAADRTVEEIFGWPDHLKFHSSMTLFARTGPAPGVFGEALERCFAGLDDERTAQLLG